MIWPAAALAILILALVVGYASVLESRLETSSGAPPDAAPGDAGLETVGSRGPAADIASAGGVV